MNYTEHIKHLNAAVEAIDAIEVLKFVVERFGTQAVMATSFGAEDQVLTDLLARLNSPVELFTLDTGRLPQETFDVMDRTQKHYGITIREYFPDYGAVEAMVAQYGPNLFYDSVDNRKRCCHVRKVEPLTRALAGRKAWICGLRCEQAVTRQSLKIFEWDEQFGLIKVCPLADWSDKQVWEYIRRYDVPYNRLHDAGYPSIGCRPCTRAVQPGQDIRAGRWWWEQPEHKECGLHLKKK